MQRLALAVVSIAMLAPAAPALGVPHGTTVLLDRPSGFGALPFDGVDDAFTDRHAISANGCFVVFTSSNDILLTTDENAATNVYRQDRCTAGHPVVQVNTSATGQPAEAGSSSSGASVSADGRYVAFASDARDLAAGLDGTTQILVKDMSLGGVEIASRAHGPNGALAGNGGTSTGVISGNGRAVAFRAYGALAGGQASGPAGQDNVYVRYLNADQTFLASTKPDGTAGGLAGNSLDLSFYGEAVIFTTTANLDPLGNDTDNGIDAYVTTNIGVAIPKVRWVSFTTGNSTGATSASTVAVSTDATTFAFGNNNPWETTCGVSTCSAANRMDFGAIPLATPQTVRDIGFGYSMSGSNPAAPARVFWTTDQPLVAGDTNGAPDTYGHLLSDLGATGISLLTTGTYPGGVFDGSATDDAGTIAFDSGSAALPGTNGSSAQAYVRSGGVTSLISQPEGQPARVGEVASSSVENLHAVTADGGLAVFTSSAPFLGVPLAGDRRPGQVFARAIASGATTPVSVAGDGSFADRDAYQPSVDAAGRRVAFISGATNLVPGVAPGHLHVYVRDLQAGTTTLVDRAAGGAIAATGADHPQISGDGTRVVFDSRSPDLPGATPGEDHVYVADLSTGAVTIADTTAAGTPGNGSGRSPDVSADGTRVAFVSDATNLGGATVASQSGAYVKDLATGELTWASVPSDATTTHDGAIEVALSADGRHVAFVDDDPQLGYGSDGLLHVFVRDLAARSTVLASLGTGVGGGEQRFASLSADGTRLTFTEYSSQITRVYLRDLTTRATVALADGRLGAFSASVSATGTCAVFASYSDDLVSPGFGPDFSHVYLRAIGSDCPVPAAGGPGGGGQPGPDRTAPVISGLRMTNRRFAPAARRTALSARAKRGTAFLFRLSEAARTTIAIARAQPGRRSGKRCVKPRKRLRKRCTRYVAVVTLRRANTKQGANRVAFTGRLARRVLAPGRYRAALVATDAAGNRSKPRRISFAVVRR